MEFCRICGHKIRVCRCNRREPTKPKKVYYIPRPAAPQCGCRQYTYTPSYIPAGFTPARTGKYGEEGSTQMKKSFWE